MIAAGIDIGSTTTKVVLLLDDSRYFGHIVPTGAVPAETAEKAFREILARQELTEQDVSVIATTGYGRRLVDMGDLVMTEIKACAAGVLFGRPDGASVRTIIDVGGQDTKVIALNENEDIEDFSMNDKCAAGTGRFLEVLAHKLNLPYEAFVEEALRASKPLHMNSTCAVFAESEVVGLLARGESTADVAGAAHDAIAARISSMVRRTSSGGPYSFVGGGARNRALLRAVEESLNSPVTVPENAQLMVALGAAVIGRRRHEKAKFTE